MRMNEENCDCKERSQVCRHPPYGRMEVRKIPAGKRAGFRCIPFSEEQVCHDVLADLSGLTGQDSWSGFHWRGSDEVSYAETWAICEVEAPSCVPTPVTISTDDRFPHRCLFCGRRSYNGFDSVEHADGLPCGEHE